MVDFVASDNDESNDEDSEDPAQLAEDASLKLTQYMDARYAETEGWCYSLQKRMAVLMISGGCLDKDAESNKDDHNTTTVEGFAFSIHATANEKCARLSYLTGLRHLESHTVLLISGLAKNLDHVATLQGNERHAAISGLHDEVDLALSSVLCAVANVTRRLKTATKARSPEEVEKSATNAQIGTNEPDNGDDDSEVRYAEKRLFQHPSVIKAIVLTLKRVFKSCSTASAALCEIPSVGFPPTNGIHSTTQLSRCMNR